MNNLKQQISNILSDFKKAGKFSDKYENALPRIMALIKLDNNKEIKKKLSDMVDLVDLKELDHYKDGVIVSGINPLHVNDVAYYKKENYYFVFVQEIDFCLRIDKESFDKAIEKKEII